MEPNYAIDAVLRYIAWYRKKSDGANIHTLLKFQDRLAAHVANLSEQYVKYSLGYNLSYINRKYSTAVNKQKARENMNVSDSADWAEIRTKKDRKQEVLNYEIAQRLQMIRQDARTILQVCMQRISYMKLEYESSKIHNQ